MRVKGQKSGVMRIFQALLVSYIITGILLLVLAVLLYKLNLDKGKVTAGITGIYVVSAFAGGFLIGKLQKVRKFIWGLMLGILYFLLLVLVFTPPNMVSSIQSRIHQKEQKKNVTKGKKTHKDMYETKHG